MTYAIHHLAYHTRTSLYELVMGDRYRYIGIFSTDTDTKISTDTNTDTLLKKWRKFYILP